MLRPPGQSDRPIDRTDPFDRLIDRLGGERRRPVLDPFDGPTSHSVDTINRQSASGPPVDLDAVAGVSAAIESEVEELYRIGRGESPFSTRRSEPIRLLEIAGPTSLLRRPPAPSRTLEHWVHSPTRSPNSAINEFEASTRHLFGPLDHFACGVPKIFDLIALFRHPFDDPGAAAATPRLISRLRNGQGRFFALICDQRRTEWASSLRSHGFWVDDRRPIGDGWWLTRAVRATGRTTARVKRLIAAIRSDGSRPISVDQVVETTVGATGFSAEKIRGSRLIEPIRTVSNHPNFSGMAVRRVEESTSASPGSRARSSLGRRERRERKRAA